MAGYLHKLIEYARTNRRTSSKSEVLLWEYLRGPRTDGLRFRRQQPIGPFIVDLYCARAKLAIEIDGESHHSEGEADRRRTEWLELNGIAVLRFTNREVIDDVRSCSIGVLHAAYLRVPELADRIDELPVF